MSLVLAAGLSSVTISSTKGLSGHVADDQPLGRRFVAILG